MKNENIIEVKNLSTEFKVGKNKIKIVKDVSLNIKRGQILSIVGESGCGKSVTVHSVVNLIPKNGKITSGEAILHADDKDYNLTKMKPFGKDMRKLRGMEIGMIFQDPMQSLNPVYTVGHQIEENIHQHRKVSKEEAREIGINMLKKLGIPEAESRYDDYPHQFSGGMKQRVMIAIAMVNNPNLLIADEPTTALDVTIQAQIMDLMKEMRDRDGKSVVLITHNMGLVAEVADQVAVMYMGRVIEYGQVKDVFENPSHPYTRAKEGAIYLKEDIFQRIKEVLAEEKGVDGIAISTAGMVDYKTGIIAYANENIKNYIGFDWIKEVKEEFGLPCVVENDVKSAALGEANFGAGKDYSSIFCLTVGTGIGGCVIIDNEIYRGASGNAGEIGYLPFEDSTIEEKSSTSAILRLGRELYPEKTLPMEKSSLRPLIETTRKLWL